MNVFVLTTGRSGSLTFVRACEHITNYTAGHETRASRLGADRLAYPDRHIEADNRLSWFLGRLDAAYGDGAFYVHLRRDPEAVAQSYRKRWNKAMMRTYRKGLLLQLDPATDELEIARDFVATVEENIRLFLRDKSQVMDFPIESSASAFPEFWERIGAEGDRESAQAEFLVRHHETPAIRQPLRRGERASFPRRRSAPRRTGLLRRLGIRSRPRSGTR